jgi:hypothetical protein
MKKLIGSISSGSKVIIVLSQKSIFCKVSIKMSIFELSLKLSLNGIQYLVMVLDNFRHPRIFQQDFFQQLCNLLLYSVNYYHHTLCLIFIAYKFQKILLKSV